MLVVPAITHREGDGEVRQKTDYLTPPEAALAANVCPQTATRWCKRIPGFARKVAGRWRIDPAAFDRLLTGQLGAEGGEHGTRHR
jgi:hypothetical protein